MKKYILPLASLAVTTVIFLTIYTVSQQVLRMDANDPQIQLAEDTAAQLNSGADPHKTTTSSVDLNASLAPFVNVYDTQGQSVAGAGYLNSYLATPPFGMLKSSDNQPYNAVTWQPSSNIRIAAVAVRASRYYVVSGRSLKEVEKQENQILALSGFGWLISIFIIACSYAILNLETLKTKSRKK
jgi:hypothetical protein